MNITEKLSEYVANAEFKDLPNAVVEKAKELILDNVGCAFGGYATGADKALIDFVKELSGRRDSTIIGDGCKVPSCLAAGVNAQMANILDFDETYRNRAHPASPIVQSAIAIAESLKANGKDLINAIVVGYEVATRIGDATHPSSELMKKVWLQNWPIFGVAAAAAKLLHLDKDKIKHSFGIAGGVAPAINVHRILDVPGAMIKLPNFWLCEAGINAVFLAQKGFTGFHDYLDGDKGYWVTVSDRCEWEMMVNRLGEEYNIQKFLSLKPWPTCRWIHPGIELVLELLQEEKIEVNEIDEIIFRAHWKVCAPPYDNPEPKTMWDAIWSVPWGIAMAVLRYEPGPEWYASERFVDPNVLSFTKKVKVVHDPEASEIFEKTPEKTFAKIELKAKGKVYVRKKEYCKGDPEMPMTKEDLRRKFRKLAGAILSKKRTDMLIRTIENLEYVDDVSELTKLFRSQKKGKTGVNS